MFLWFFRFMQKTYNSLNIIFIAFTSSALVYLVIALILRSTNFQAVAPTVAMPLFIVLLMVCFSNVAISQMIKKRSFGEPLPHFDGQDKLDAYVKSKYIVMFALSEVPAIFGLVYFMLTGMFWRMVILVGISLLSLALIRPDLAELEDFQRRTV